MTLHRYFNSRDALLEATGLEMIRLSNHIIDEAIAQHNHPREQLQAIVMQASQMGERFHFLMHASEEIDDALFSPQIQKLDDRMTEIIEALREEGLIRKDMPNAWLLHLYGGVLTAAWSSLRDGAVAPRDITNAGLAIFYARCLCQCVILANLLKRLKRQPDVILSHAGSCSFRGS